MALAWTAPAVALDWRFEPRVSGSVTYTDNANQSKNAPEDAVILGVTPGFSLTSEGSRRVKASLNYSLKGTSRIGYDEKEDIRHDLNAAGKAELVEDFLFIDGTARISQELISMFGPLAETGINDSNRADVGTYSISPYIQKRLGTFAQVKARYTASGAIFGSNANTADSQVNAFAAALESGTRFNDLRWALNYSIRKADYHDAADTTFERLSGTASYTLTRKFRVFGTIGEDRNDYLSNTKTNGSFYSVGLGWAPTRRTSVEASVGERYWGRTFSLAASHRTRATQWNARYSENVSDITQQFLERTSETFWVCKSGLPVREAFDETNPDPASCIGPVSWGTVATALYALGYSSIEDLIKWGLVDVGSVNGVYLIKSFDAGVSWDIGRLGFGLSAQNTRRLYEALNDAEDRVQGVTGTVTYRLSRHTTANGNLSLSRHSADAAVLSGTARNDDVIALTMGMTHSFTQDLTGTLTFRHTQRDSNVDTSDYTENRLTGTVNLRF